MISIALATDRRYLPWAATLIRSALDRHPDGGLSFNVLHTSSLDDDDARALERMTTDAGSELHVHAVAPPRMPRTDRFGSSSLLRFELATVLPNLQRVLYLDADTFIVAPLDELWSTPLEQNRVAAVANVLEPAWRPHVQGLGLADHRSFFNSGVMVMDLDGIRRDDPAPALLRYVEKHTTSPWPDQDALNVVFAGRWTKLPPRFNAMNSLWTWRSWANDTYGDQAVKEAVSAPVVLHFEGPHLRKPWHYLSDHVYRDAYRATSARTPWAATPLEDESRGTRLIAKLPRRLRVPAYIRLLRVRGKRSS